jgi:hypothetical protein
MKAYELLSDKTKWCQHVYSEDSKGEYVPPEAPDAACWCIKGAIHRCYPDFEEDYDNPIFQKLVDNVPPCNVICPVANFNDSPSTTFEQVRELLIKLDI